MKVSVDQDLCVSCGFCVDNCPEVFSWNDEGKSQAIAGDVPEDLEEATRECIEGCPTEAIKEL
ncbi:ferredoxin [Carboxydothermus pertinax]|uniref:Ferredoxin n=1 Tax=Carboxydothermus pertinax TaxID=870242 RepID=A0A1L8CYB5_9THEO|nr:ferredoxin [Carboxydothermus pertinax]GAV23887.1 ferredoxin [Carboxydothermus pertinax]